MTKEQQKAAHLAVCERYKQGFVCPLYKVKKTI
jgi:hypothetical protein